jgi:hypothetical protein
MISTGPIFTKIFNQSINFRVYSLHQISIKLDKMFGKKWQHFIYVLRWNISSNLRIFTKIINQSINFPVFSLHKVSIKLDKIFEKKWQHFIYVLRWNISYNLPNFTKIITIQWHNVISSLLNSNQIDFKCDNDRKIFLWDEFMELVINYVNNCPTICNYIQFIYTCKLLYMFRVVSPPIIRSSYHCIYSIWHYCDRYCNRSLMWLAWNWGCSNGHTNAGCCKYSDMSSWW